MKKHSTNTYSTSSGERLTRQQIESKIKAAKKRLFEIQAENYGYNFCGRCRSNDCKPLDASHITSVKECLETGMAELAYALSNLQILGRKCHQEHDKLNLQWQKSK